MTQEELDYNFFRDLENGLERESVFMSRNKDLYLNLMGGLDLSKRMELDGITLKDSYEKIRELGDRPESYTRNGLLTHCICNNL